MLICYSTLPDMGRTALPHPTQTNLHTTILLPRASRPLTAGIGMRTRHRLE
jgi:hypothetical protein